MKGWNPLHCPDSPAHHVPTKSSWGAEDHPALHTPPEHEFIRFKKRKQCWNHDRKTRNEPRETQHGHCSSSSFTPCHTGQTNPLLQLEMRRWGIKSSSYSCLKAGRKVRCCLLAGPVCIYHGLIAQWITGKGRCVTKPPHQKLGVRILGKKGD